MAWTNILGQTRVGIRGAAVSQTQTTSLLLDSYSGSAAAYSLRKLTSTYTGNAIRVRRSSDNTEMNIGFDAGGNLNTVSLLAFVGSGNGFVTTWYDQSGNGRNITQTTASTQPKIVNAGSIYRLNGLPSIYFYDNWLSSNLLTMPINNVTNTTVSSSFTTDSLGWGGSNYQSILSFGALSEYIGYATYYTYSNGLFEFNSESRLSNTVVYGQKTSTSLNKVNLSFNYNGNTQFSSWLNSNSYGSSTFSNSNLSTQQYLVVGSRWHGSGFYFHLRGYVSESIVWNNDKTSNRTGIESNINSYYSIYASDTDAQAFISAAGITDGTQMSAVNTLVVDLKAAGVWNKMKALYPFVGGSATSHKFNLKDPRDLDAAYRLTFVGGWTHSSSGAQSNGTTGYANPNINANQIFTSTDGLMGVYTPSTSLINSSYIYGVSNMADSEWGMYYGSGSLSFGMYRSNSVSSTTTLPGLSAIGMETNGHRSVYKNNSRLISSAAGFISMPQNLKMYLSARNANVNVDAFTGGLYSFSFISSTLTLTEYSAFYTAVQKYQTTLGRQIGTPVGNSNIVTGDIFLNLDGGNPSSYSGTGTTWTNLSGVSNSTLVNGVSYSSENGGSMVFDGSNDYVNTNITSTNPEVTVDLYVSISSNTSTKTGSNAVNQYILFRQNTRTTDFEGIYVGYNINTGCITVAMTSGTAVVKFLNTSALTLNRVYHICATFNSNTLTLYLNGQQIGQVSTGFPINYGNKPFFIGSSNDTFDGFLNGKIYSVKLYSKTLSSTEVLQNFNATKSRFGL